MGGWFCKTRLYVIDPNSQKVLRNIVTNYEDIILIANLVATKNAVYQIIRGYGKNAPSVLAYDPATGYIAQSTRNFMGRKPELKAGLASRRALPSIPKNFISRIRNSTKLNPAIPRLSAA